MSENHFSVSFLLFFFSVISLDQNVYHAYLKSPLLWNCMFKKGRVKWGIRDDVDLINGEDFYFSKGSIFLSLSLSFPLARIFFLSLPRRFIFGIGYKKI